MFILNVYLINIIRKINLKKFAPIIFNADNKIMIKIQKIKGFLEKQQEKALQSTQSA